MKPISKGDLRFLRQLQKHTAFNLNDKNFWLMAWKMQNNTIMWKCKYG